MTLHQEHRQEWLDSGINADIIELNVESITGPEAFERLYSNLDHKARRNDGRLRDYWLRKHDEVADTSGWWVTGVDPHMGQAMAWGRYKPTEGSIHDRVKGKAAKYVSPAGVPSRLILLQVPEEIWELVSVHCGIPIEKCDQERGFWHWVWRCNVPIVLCEGEKKAGALLSKGYAAIALPGIFNGYRIQKDADGKWLCAPSLIPDLAIFDTPHRQVTICFDFEEKPKTARRVRQAAIRTASCFKKSQVRVASLPGPYKGVDDFLVAGGNFERIRQQAKKISTLKSEDAWQLTAPVDLALNERYLGKLPLPKSGLAIIKSPKGTGKTTAFQDLVPKAVGAGQKTLLLTHRIVLGQAICDAVGIPYVTEAKGTEQGRTLGFGLCVDSCHSQGQGRINPEDWAGGIILIDEAEQVLWHLLNSTTCREKRVAILKTFKRLIYIVLSTGGLVIAQDADISDYTVEFLQSCAGFPIKPWVCVNSWKPSKGWNVTFYESEKKDNPSALLENAASEVNADGVIWIQTDSQKAKSKWGTKNIESYMRRKCPGKKILRIDSETTADPKHPAYGCVGNLNEIVAQYDVIIASPTLATGVSVDLKEHFSGVYGIFQGSTPANEALQSLSRVREPVPRYMWARPQAVGKIGNGEDYYKQLADNRTDDVRLNSRLLQEADFDIDKAHDAIALRTWAKMGARINLNVRDYREAIKQGLIAEGHSVTSTSLGETSEEAAAAVGAEMKAIRDESVDKEAQAVAAAAELTEQEYELLQDKRSRTEEENLSERKYQLHKNYGIEVQPTLHILDQNGWYSQARLHYYLTHDSRYLELRDRKHLVGHIERGEGQVAAQDIQLLSLQVRIIKKLGILEFATSGRQWSANSPEVQATVGKMLKCSKEIKRILGITISQQMAEKNPIRAIQYVLGKLGKKLKSRQQRNENGEREWVYQGWEYKSMLERDTSLREAVFTAWQKKDEQALEWILIDEEAAAAKLEVSSAPITPSAPAQKSCVTEEIEPTPALNCHNEVPPIQPEIDHFDPEIVSSSDTELSHQIPYKKETKVTGQAPQQVNKRAAKFADDDQPETAPFKQGALVRWAGKVARFTVTWCGIGTAAIRDVASGQAFNAPTYELEAEGMPT